MFDPKILQAGFQSIVGIRQSNVPGLPPVLPPLSDSLSGIYVDDKNPLASTENMYYSAPNFEFSVFPSWKTGSNYAKGIPASYLSKLYITVNSIFPSVINPSIDANALPWVSNQSYLVGNIVIDTSNSNSYWICSNDITSATPPHSDLSNWNSYTHVWEIYNPFQSWLQQKYNQAVTNLFHEIIRKKKMQHMVKAVLDRTQLYRGGGSLNEKIISQGRFVGFSILPQQAEGLWVYIDKVGFQSTSTNDNMKFYLYHSDSETPIGSWTVNITTANTFSWNDLMDGSTPAQLNCIMKYLKENTNGVYFFGYFETDVTGQAIGKQWNCNAFPCQGCDGTDVTMYNLWSQYTTLRNISVPANGLNGTNLFDVSKAIYDMSTNWGMNLSLTVRCNITDFILYSKMQYVDVFAMQVCKEFLESISKGIRLGPSPAQTKLSAIADLDRKSPGAWINDYDEAIKSLDFDMSGFSKACLPDDKIGKSRQFIM